MAKRKLVAASVPQLSQTVREITSERAGSMSEAERKDLHELLQVTAAALSTDESRKADAVKSAEAQRVAKRQRVAAASKDAGARLNMGALQCLKGDVAAKCLAFLRAKDFRSLAQIKCDEVSAGVLRSGVAMACDALAPYASPPQLTLGTCGWEPLAVLEDAMARADSFYASQPRRPWARLLRVRARSSLVVGGVLPAPNPAFVSNDEGPIQECETFLLHIASYCGLDDCPITAPSPRCERDATRTKTQKQKGRGKRARSADVRSARAMAASSKRHHATTSASASLCAAARLCGNQRVERPRETTPRRQADVGKRSGASSA